MPTLDARISALEVGRGHSAFDSIPKSPEELDLWILSFAQRDRPDLTLEVMHAEKEASRLAYNAANKAVIESATSPGMYSGTPRTPAELDDWYTTMSLWGAWSEYHYNKARHIA